MKKIKRLILSPPLWWHKNQRHRLDNDSRKLSSHLGALLSEWTLSPSPRLSEARDRLHTDRRRWQ